MKAGLVKSVSEHLVVARWCLLSVTFSSDWHLMKRCFSWHLVMSRWCLILAMMPQLRYSQQLVVSRCCLVNPQSQAPVFALGRTLAERTLKNVWLPDAVLKLCSAGGFAGSSSRHSLPLCLPHGVQCYGHWFPKLPPPSIVQQLILSA